jgi:hypothetical protein
MRPRSISVRRGIAQYNAACAATAIRPPSQDDKGSRALLEQFLESWNQHDAQAFPLVFSPDADLTNWRGQHVRGRGAIEEKFQPLFSGPRLSPHRSSATAHVRGREMLARDRSPTKLLE